VVGDQPPIAPDPHPVTIGGHLDAAADRGRVYRVVIAVQPHVVVARQRSDACHPVTGATSGSGSRCRRVDAQKAIGLRQLPL
jgi:hypothetical protein